MWNLGLLHGEFYFQYCVLNLDIESQNISMTKPLHGTGLPNMKFRSSVLRCSNPYMPVNRREGDEQFPTSLNIHFWPCLELHIRCQAGLCRTLRAFEQCYKGLSVFHEQAIHSFSLPAGLVSLCGSKPCAHFKTVFLTINYLIRISSLYCSSNTKTM